MNYRRTQSGVALVITLIMLSVITLIAVAFLLLSQRERASVASTMVATDAELMANTGLEASKAYILGQIIAFATNNPANRTFTNAQGQWITARLLGPDLTVSVVGDGSTNYAQTTADYQALTNLLIDPSAPVFVSRGGVRQSVHYIDLNRNGRFDETGYVLARDNNGNQITGVTNFVIGDPQWIGMPFRPNEPYSSSNRFVGRYAYIIIPVGRASNIDFIHNTAAAGLFSRNQGHGSWELNLAALLTDLNTNFWRNYDYNTIAGQGFLDATNILAYRHGATSLRTAQQTFGTNTDFFAGDGIDQYGNGNDSSGLWSSEPWAGAPSRQHFFSIHDFFNAKTPTFQDRLLSAGLSLNSYDRHTFYRMLAQLVTDTAPEKMRYRVRVNSQGKPVGDDGPINLNYANTYVGTSDVDATDFVPWTAESFFHATADRLLRDHGFAIDANTPLSVTNLPVYPTNFYTPAVHRLLQMTLNIFDATTNKGAAYPYYPTALRPVFEGSDNFVRIVGYEDFGPTPAPNRVLTITNVLRWRDLSNQAERASLIPDWNSLAPSFVYGVPVLIGAKKGFPNFNEYVFQSIAQVHRELNIDKRQGQIATTNHVFYLGISNYMALEAWNSYMDTYPRDLILAAGAKVTSSLTNELQLPIFPAGTSNPKSFEVFSAVSVTNNTWRGREFRIPLAIVPTNGWAFDNFLPYSIYHANTRQFMPTNSAYDTDYPAPQWVLTTTNRVRFFLFDNPAPGEGDERLVDAVGLAPSVSSINITKALHDMGDPQNPALAGGTLSANPFWLTNRVRGNNRDTRDMTQGIREQFVTSQTGSPAWNDYGFFRHSPQWPTVTLAKDGFAQFLTGIRNNSFSNVTQTNMWAPFVPQMKVYQQFVWQANDPLVHHLAQDLRFATNDPPQYSLVNRPNYIIKSIGQVNPSYQPWGQDFGKNSESTEMSVKDAMFGRLGPGGGNPPIGSSDDWDFPTNKFANIGLLGKVHRGTPWQTIYFKPGAPPDATWAKYHRGGRFSNPTNDWRLADIFTVAQHPNASRGRMSVNQTNVAGWSAVLSGIRVPALDRRATPVMTNTIIEPALKDPTLDKLVEAINFRRQQLPGEIFSSLSEFLAVPELTTNSPYLTPLPSPVENPILDADYEAIPQKIASLLKAGEPRFVVYVFGQSLKPAPQSVIPGGPFRGLCVNYEVTGEMAAKAVMRVDLVPVPPPNPVPAGGYLPVRPQAVIESFNLLPPD